MLIKYFKQFINELTDYEISECISQFTAGTGTIRTVDEFRETLDDLLLAFKTYQEGKRIETRSVIAIGEYIYPPVICEHRLLDCVEMEAFRSLGFKRISQCENCDTIFNDLNTYYYDVCYEVMEPQGYESVETFDADKGVLYTDGKYRLHIPLPDKLVTRLQRLYLCPTCKSASKEICEKICKDLKITFNDIIKDGLKRDYR